MLDQLRQDREKLVNRPKERDDPPGLDQYGGIIEESYRWGTYGNGAHGREGYFGEGLGSFVSIVPFETARENIATVKGDHKALVLDVMGTGEVGVDLGADIAVGWTYQDHHEKPRAPNQIVEGGDLFEKEIAADHLVHLDKQLAEEGAVLAAVFFRSEGGYAMYKDNLYANAILYETYLRKLYTRAPAGAHFYLSINNDESYGRQLLSALKEKGYHILEPPQDSTDIRNYTCVVLVKTDEKDTLPPARSFLEGLEVIEKNSNT